MSANPPLPNHPSSYQSIISLPFCTPPAPLFDHRPLLLFPFQDAASIPSPEGSPWWPDHYPPLASLSICSSSTSSVLWQWLEERNREERGEKGGRAGNEIKHGQEKKIKGKGQIKRMQMSSEDWCWARKKTTLSFLLGKYKSQRRLCVDKRYSAQSVETNTYR